jgi:hypothetical protein
MSTKNKPVSHNIIAVSWCCRAPSPVTTIRIDLSSCILINTQHRKLFHANSSLVAADNDMHLQNRVFTFRTNNSSLNTLGL